MEDMNDRPIPPFPEAGQVHHIYPSSVSLFARYLPYICAQVGRLGRGQIGLDSDGKVVFYLPIIDLDKIGNESLHDVDEVWVVLKPSTTLTDPYS